MNEKLLQSPLFDEIQKYFKKSNENEQIFIFVPYIKKNIIEKLLHGISNKITIITTWNTNDLISGSSDIKLFEWCKKNGNYLYIHDNIHLKVYSRNLESVIVSSSNISQKGLMSNGNYEAGTCLEKLTNEGRLYLEKIKSEARFVDDFVYQQYLKNYEECKKNVVIQEVFPQPEIKSKEELFLRSALPMTDSMNQVVNGYIKIQSKSPPSEDYETANCIFHDIANFNIPENLTQVDVIKELRKQFLNHPFTKKIMDEIDNHERKHFGMIQGWIQEHCTEVPLPRIWEFKTNTKILMNWLVESGEYEEFQYGTHTKSIKRINTDSN